MTDPDRLQPLLDPLLAPEMESASDADLIRLVRDGDSAAYEHLFVRHREVAIRYARRIADSERAEDLCAEAFAKILDLLQRGKGPDVAFRAYLLTTVRTSHLNTIRASSREDLVPDHEPISRMTPTVDNPDARFDASAIYRAFDTLPERWRAALWLTSVEGLSNDEASKHLGVRVNAVASLAFRARAGLRQAYLREHLLEITDPQCRRIIELLPGYLRGSVSDRRRALIDTHLAGCASCTTAALELTEVNSRLGAVLAPLALVGLGGAAVVIPAKATTLTAVGVASLIGTGSAVGGFVKGAVTGTALQVKAAGSALSGLVSTKLAVAATATALGLAVGSEVLLHSEPQADLPATEQVLLPPPSDPTSPAARRPARVATTPRPTPTRLQVLPPTTSAPRTVSTTGPTTGATPNAVVTTAPAAPTSAPASAPSASAARMSVGQPSTQSYTQWGVRRDKVTVPVTNPTADSFLQVTATHTLDTALATTTSTGWVCGTPTANWFDGGLYATSRISCVYTGNGPAGPLTFDYQVVAGSTLTAALTPPAGYRDDLSDNVGRLLLR